MEVMKLVYRQMLLWMGMIISPFIFGLGLLTTLILYWVQYGTLMQLHKRPKNIAEHDLARNTERDLFFVFFLANLCSFAPFIAFAVGPTNPTCGPLRSYECAVGFQNGNLTACIADQAGERKNFAALADALLPDEDSGVNLFRIAGLANGTLTEEESSCDAVCIVKHIFQLFVSTEVLLPVAMIMIIGLVFALAVSARRNVELREARVELSIEYQDKKKMARYARVDL